jgi:hypothetical protein
MLPSKDGVAPALPPDLPGHAERCARRIFGLDPRYKSLSELRTALSELMVKPDTLAFKARAGQLALAAAFPVLAAVATITILFMSARLAGGSVYTMTYISEIKEDGHPEKQDAKHRPLSEEDRAAREILIAHGLDSPVRKLIEDKASPAAREIIERALEHHAHPSEAEVAWARALIDTRAASDPDPFSHPFDDPLRVLTLVLGIVCTVWCAFALIFAFGFRGGMSLTVFNVLVRDKSGRPASRLRCLGRAAVAGIPLALLYWTPAMFIELRNPTATYAAVAVALLAHAAWVFHALSRPTQSLQDLALGTRLVPR